MNVGVFGADDHSLPHLQAQNQLNDPYKCRPDRNQTLSFIADEAGLAHMPPAAGIKLPTRSPLHDSCKGTCAWRCPIIQQMQEWTPGQGCTLRDSPFIHTPAAGKACLALPGARRSAGSESRSFLLPLFLSCKWNGSSLLCRNGGPQEAKRPHQN